MEAKRKVHSLTGRITPELMLAAFKAVKRNRGACGVDKVSIQMFEKQLENNLSALMKRLKAGTYRPKPLRRAYIPKGKNQRRGLGIPAVRDRVAQEVIRRLLEPIFEPLFHNDSFGFRKRRNCHMAIKRLLQLLREGYRFVVDADIKAFFDSIPHGLIMAALAHRVADGNILDIVRKFLSCGVMQDGVLSPTTKGTPQGGVISPLLANIVLDALDRHLDCLGYLFVRYADDFVVLTKERTQAEKALAEIDAFLTSKLNLELSPEKTRITTFSQGFDFLGFTIAANGVRMRLKSVERFRDKVRMLTIRCHNMDKDVIEKLNRLIRGTANYFAAAFSYCRHQFDMLDQFTRRRLRCMKYKSISRRHNMRLRLKHFGRAGLLSLTDFLTCCQRAHSISPA
jgi:group II intron reverse transcriptase/maturase